MEAAQGSTLAIMGRLDLAVARFNEAAKRHEHLEDLGSLAEDLTALAGLKLDEGKLDEALELATRAVEKAEVADDRPREIDSRVKLSQIQGRKGRWQEASDTLEEAVLLVRQVARDRPVEQIILLITAAATDHRAGRVDRARERLTTAKKVAEEANDAEVIRFVDSARQELEDVLKAPPQPLPR